MIEPTVSQSGETIVVSFKNTLGIGFQHFREGRDGTVAEVCVYSAAHEEQLRLGPVRISIMLQRDMSELARNCLKLFGEIITWDDIIPKACACALHKYRAGTRPVILAHIEDPGPPEYLVPGFLLKDSNVFLSAYGGSAKSVVAMRVGVSVATGEPFADMRPSDMGPVLYLDWEDEEGVGAGRMHAISRGMDLDTPPENLFYWSQRKPLRDSVSAIQKFVAEEGVILVIIDSIGAAIGGELTKDEAALQGMAACKSLSPVSRLIISHVSKADADKRAGERRTFGSAFFEFGARDVWQVGKYSTVGASTIGVSFSNTKCNHGLKDSFGLQIAFHDNEIRFSRNNNMANDVAGSDGLSQSALVYSIIHREDREIDVKDLANYSGLTPKQVHSSLYKLKISGRVIEVNGLGPGHTALYSENQQMRDIPL